jgi:hypothetical protein
MRLRNSLVAVVMAAALGVACSGREDPIPDPPDNGCTGVCNQNDGGTNKPDAGPRVCPAADAQGRGPIGRLRATGTRGQTVRLDGLVVTVVDKTDRGSQGDYIAYFWAVDPCFPKEGIYVDKFYTDPVTNYLPAVGDVLTVEGLYRQYTAPAATGAPMPRTAAASPSPTVSAACGIPTATCPARTAAPVRTEAPVPGTPGTCPARTTRTPMCSIPRTATRICQGSLPRPCAKSRPGAPFPELRVYG